VEDARTPPTIQFSILPGEPSLVGAIRLSEEENLVASLGYDEGTTGTRKRNQKKPSYLKRRKGKLQKLPLKSSST